MYRWQCQFARTVTRPFCSVRHTEFSSYVSLAMSVRQYSNWTVLFGSSYRVCPYVSLAMSVRKNSNWAVSFSSPYRTMTRNKKVR